MSRINRVFLIVLDSFGMGELPDAASYGDEGSNTLAAVCSSDQLNIPNLTKLGLFNIEGAVEPERRVPSPTGSFARLAEQSKGKDTTIGHWEIAGIISPSPLPTYPDGFPPEVLAALETAWGRGVLCNKPYSGTQVIAEYGEQHIKTGDLIVYTSADSVLQIAAHEEIVPIEELYAICKQAREIMQGKHGVGRIIARPFVGTPGSFTRTTNRHDFSLLPPSDTVLDLLQGSGLDTIGVGKIYDIFAGKGISETYSIKGNEDGMNRTLALAKKDFRGLCFINLVDFDMLYGHRNDVHGYAAALTRFDEQLGELLPLLRETDLLMITADHGCDPATPSTDHSREYVPLLISGSMVKQGVDLGTRPTFADIAATLLDIYKISGEINGRSFLQNVITE